jgi:hypothetical protein
MTEERLGAGKYGFVDLRRSKDMAYEDPPDTFGIPFSLAEFSQLGLNVDYQEYERKWLNSDHRTSEEVLKERDVLKASLIENPTNSNREIFEETISGADERAAAADFVVELESQFQFAIDRAFAQVFEALASGKLASEGWSFATEDDENCQPNLEPIKSELWTLKKFVLGSDFLATRSGNFHAVQVKLEDAIAGFPAPNVQGRTKTCLVVGDSVIFEGEEAVTPPRKSVGRPQRGNFSAMDVIQRVFSEKRRKNELPEKKEAVIQEAIEFARDILGEEIGRSTIQGYLKNV